MLQKEPKNPEGAKKDDFFFTNFSKADEFTSHFNDFDIEWRLLIS
jgi:hypothetical protein